MVVYNDSLVVVRLILGNNMAIKDHMVAYLTRAQAATQRFINVIFIKVPRTQNNKADRLSFLKNLLIIFFILL